MNRRDRERAQRISEYADALVVHRREAGLRPFRVEDREFLSLTELARTLHAVKLKEPADFREELRGRLPRMAATPEGAGPAGWFSAWWMRRTDGWRAESSGWSAAWRRVTRTMLAMAPVLALAMALAWQVAGSRTLSAAEVLGRADVALAGLVHENQVLHRRWKVTDRVRTADGAFRVFRESTSDEWMAGSDFSRVSGRNEVDGRVYLAYTSDPDGDEVRPRVYFAPGFSNEPRGLLSIEPTRPEYQQALASFADRDRETLTAYLDRGYIFAPISGERRFNRIALEEGTAHDEPLPRIRISLREETLPPGTKVYVLRIVDPARVRFRWKSHGAPVTWLERREIVRYIAKDTYLSLKAEETYENETGRRIFTTRELIDTKVIDQSPGMPDPFALAVPAGTPVRRQSAIEQLTAVAAVLGQISETETR